ncbi:hypothetical protein CHS0354_032869 [Potamilus streckersoni]|uniref:Uncharacterized protein n=1 Tax=Potamilus streckersoni TaxID=2493646 RepID=A0AAE0T1X7_9BIVA|nr:hypothetical protein CHS0354_032869 [Potamilus streckersoni]
MKFLVLAVLIALASTQTEANVFTDVFNKLKDQLQQLGQTFGNTFLQLGSTALATGGDLLTQALGGGAQLLSAGATQLAQNLLISSGTASTGTKRAISAVVEQEAKDVLNAFATDLKDKLHGEYAAAVRELQALAFESLFLSHDQLKQKVQQIVSSHSNQMTALLESLPADLVKFVEKALLHRRRGLLDGLLGSLTQTASQLAAQFLPHVQNVQQLLGNLGQTLTGTATGLLGELVSTLTDVHHSVQGALSGALQTATGSLNPANLLRKFKMCLLISK